MNFYTRSGAAKLKGCSKKTIYRAVKRGRLVETPGGISEESLSKWTPSPAYYMPPRKPPKPKPKPPKRIGRRPRRDGGVLIRPVGYYIGRSLHFRNLASGTESTRARSALEHLARAYAAWGLAQQHRDYGSPMAKVLDQAGLEHWRSAAEAVKMPT